MQFRTALGAIALLLPGVDARLTGFSMNSMMKPGDSFGFDIHSSDSEHEDTVMPITWGYEPVATAWKGSLGRTVVGTTIIEKGTYIENPPLDLVA